MSILSSTDTGIYSKLSNALILKTGYVCNGSYTDKIYDASYTLGTLTAKTTTGTIYHMKEHGYCVCISGNWYSLKCPNDLEKYTYYVKVFFDDEETMATNPMHWRVCAERITHELIRVNF